MIALGNKGSSFSFNPLAPSTTIWTVLVVSGPKPRLVASSRAHATAAFRPPNVAQVFLLIGPCSLPSGPRRSVYITTTITSLPFLLLSPFFRPSFLPCLDAAGIRKNNPWDAHVFPAACSTPVRSLWEGTYRPARSPIHCRRPAGRPSVA